MTCLLFWAAARRFYQLCAVWKVSVELERSAACDAQHIHQFLSKTVTCWAVGDRGVITTGRNEN